MRFLTTLLAVTALTAQCWAIPELPVEVKDVEPENGSTLRSISTIEINFDWSVYTGQLESTPNFTALVVERDGSRIDATPTCTSDWNFVTLTFSPALDVPGLYTIRIPEGSFLDVDMDDATGTQKHTPDVVLTYTVSQDAQEAAFSHASPESGSTVDCLEKVTLSFNVPDGQELKAQSGEYFNVTRMVNGTEDKSYYNPVKNVTVSGNEAVLTFNRPITDPGDYEILAHDFAFTIGSKSLRSFLLEYKVTGENASTLNCASITKTAQPLDSLSPKTPVEFDFMAYNLGTNDITSVGYRLSFRATGEQEWELYEQRNYIEMEHPVQPDGQGPFKARFITPSIQGNYEARCELIRVNGAVSDNSNTEPSRAVEFTFSVIEQSGINPLTTEDAPVEYYDLLGRKILNPRHGVYIRVQDHQVTKESL